MFLLNLIKIKYFFPEFFPSLLRVYQILLVSHWSSRDGLYWANHVSSDCCYLCKCQKVRCWSVHLWVCLGCCLLLWGEFCVRGVSPVLSCFWRKWNEEFRVTYKHHEYRGLDRTRNCMTIWYSSSSDGWVRAKTNFPSPTRRARTQPHSCL